MKAQEAFWQLLKEGGKPELLRDLARRAIERGMVSSSSKDPVFSIMTTVAKNIREGSYNRPELVSFVTEEGRKIALPQWNSDHRVSGAATTPQRGRALTWIIHE